MALLSSAFSLIKIVAFFQDLQNDLWKERWQRELLEKDALNMKSQIAQVSYISVLLSCYNQICCKHQ